MAWLLLAVFVALAGLTAAAVARAGPAPERPGVRRAGGLGRRVGDDRGAADGRPHARRAHAARLAARTLTNAGFASWYRSMGVDKRFSGVAGLRLRRDRARGPARRLPARQARLLLPADGSASPARAWPTRSATPPSPASTSARSPSCSATRATPASSARIVVSSSARPRDVRGRRAGLPRRRRARRTLDERRAPRHRLDHRPVRRRADPALRGRRPDRRLR